MRYIRFYSLCIVFLVTLFSSNLYAQRGGIPNSSGLFLRFLALAVSTATSSANFRNSSGSGTERETITQATLFDDFSLEVGYAFNSKIAIHAGIYYRHAPESFDAGARPITITALPFGVSFFTRNSWYFAPILFLTPRVSYAGNALAAQGLSYGLTVGWENRISDYWSIGIAFRFWRFETRSDQIMINRMVLSDYRRQDTIVSALTFSVTYR